MAKTAEDYIVDFSKEEKGGRTQVKDGVYKFKIVAAKPTKSANKETPGLQLTLAFREGSAAKRKKKLVETLWLTRKAYSRVRELMEACDIRVPKGKLDILKLIPKLKGQELYCDLVTESSEDYGDKSVVKFSDGFIGLDDYDAEDEDSEDDEDEDTEDEDEEDEDEDEDEEPEDEEDEDEDEEDEEPKRKKSSKSRTNKSKGTTSAKTKRASKKSKKAADDEDEEEDEDEFDLDDL